MNTHNIISAVYTTANTDPGAPVQVTRANGNIETRRNDDDIDGGGMLAFLAGGGTIDPYVAPPISSGQVDAERDRRIAAGIVYSNTNFQTSEDARANISGAQGLSLAAMIVDPGGTAGLRWANPNVDFSWTSTDNTEFPMTAAVCQDFCVKAMSYKTALIKTARALKDMDPIPVDYANNSYWPSDILN
jgi:hypothetical protein